MPELSPPYVVNNKAFPVPERRIGLAVPYGVSYSGGFLTVFGEENDTKTIALSLLSEQSENPFQQPTQPIEASIFDLHDPVSLAVVRRKLDEVFRDFELQHRFKLIPESVEFRHNDGETVCYFKYYNLESDQIKEMVVGA